MPQTQTPTRFHKPGRLRDYTPGSDTYSGDIVVIGNRCFLAAADIAGSTTTALGVNGTPLRGALHEDGQWAVPKDASTFSDGDPVFWNATGNPTGGTNGTGAATSSPAGAVFMGYAVVEDGTSVLTGDATVIVDAAGAPKHRETVNADVAATGSTQADAAQVYEGFTVVTGADATKGVILPTAVPGMRVTIKNGTAAVLKVYPKTGGAINAVATNGAFSVPASTPVILVAKTPTQWYSIPLLPS